MSNYKKFIIVFTVFLAMNFFLANLSVAETAGTGETTLQQLERQTEETTDIAGYAEKYSPQTLPDIIAGIIKVFLGLLGIIFLVLIIYAGYNWMTAQGEEEKVTKAKDTLTRAIIGLIIIIAAYSITYFVFKSLPGEGGTVGDTGAGYQE